MPTETWEQMLLNGLPDSRMLQGLPWGMRWLKECPYFINQNIYRVGMCDGYYSIPAHDDRALLADVPELSPIGHLYTFDVIPRASFVFHYTAVDGELKDHRLDGTEVIQFRLDEVHSIVNENSATFFRALLVLRYK